ncbi:MAG: response regulator [Pirellulaceae bacterium]|nr:MAG: response regulator [Pirellulaceae bacterium]
MQNARQCLLLVVEDDPYDAKLIERAFRKARIVNPLRFVQDGESAIDYFAGNPPYEDRSAHPVPELLLLDLKLPRKDGFEVLRWLRAHEVYRRLPVVVLTSSSETNDINRAYDLGANSYLVKPVGNDQLVEMLRSLELYWLCFNTSPVME